MTGHPPPGLPWGLPFAGVLLSIALLSTLAPRLWHRRLGAIMGGWIAALLLPWWFANGLIAAGNLFWNALAIEYLPFVTLLLALYAAAGGVLVRGGTTGTARGNTAMLAIGMILGAVMGQAGAALVMINPLLRANAHRRRKLHLVLFLIVLVANASGALSPLGNPPLYIGFLAGVPFFWPLEHLIAPLAVMTALLLGAFYLLDRRLSAGEPPPPPTRLRIRGWPNIILILLTGATVLAQGRVAAGNLTRYGAIVIFLSLTAISLWVTPKSVRQANDFTWEPMREVALLFVAIFVTIEPVLAMLHAGLAGPLAPLLRLTHDAAGAPRPIMFFWLAGILSAFLDNAPTYLVFFNIADIHAPAITAAQTAALSALSAGAVFFGGLTYIGNAPNMMVRGIAAHRGVRMPGFLSYFGLACTVLLPVFAVLTALFFR